METAWNPGTVGTYRIGGGSVIEIHTDQGLSGIGPGIDNAALERLQAQLIGMDPFGIEQLAGSACATTWAKLRVVFRAWKLRCGTWPAKPPGSRYTSSGACPAKDRVPAYADMIQLSTPEGKESAWR